MLQNETAVTRYVSFLDNPRQPLQLRLGPDQEIVAEEEPAGNADGQLQRFFFVRGPANRPICLIRRERLPDGTSIWVRYAPDLDEPCL